jgi:magnesium-transporting ATPase (P-type)
MNKMSFWIDKNEKAKEVWKWISETVKVFAIMIWIINVILKWRDDANNTVSDFQLVTQWIVITLFCSFLMLNFIHWLKPIWFEKRDENEE